MIKISKHKLVVPEARAALEKYKMEIANEIGLDDKENLTSKQTGLIVKNLVADGLNLLVEEGKKNPKT